MNVMSQYTRKMEKGFTLIEMLAVIAIIGILTSIVYPDLSGSRERARDSERVTEISEIVLALELYYNACRTYPSSLPANPTTMTDGCPSGVNLGSFLSSIPVDPLNSGTHVYTYAQGGGSFVVRASLEQNNSALSNDLDGTILSTPCDDGSPNFYYCKGR